MQDAYGKLMLDHLRGLSPAEIIERDDGRIEDAQGLRDYFADFRAWPARQRAAIRFVRGRVLDIGSGAGRCCLYLQRRGHDVFATDNSPLAIKTCKLRGVKRAKVVPITRLSRALGTFDTILMMGNNFGLFANHRRARWLLRRFLQMTSPRARIIAETLDPYKTKDTSHLAYHRRNRRRGRMSGQARLRVRYKNFCSPWFDYLFVSKPEMKAILRGSGWRVARFLQSGGPVYIAIIERE